MFLNVNGRPASYFIDPSGLYDLVFLMDICEKLQGKVRVYVRSPFCCIALLLSFHPITASDTTHPHLLNLSTHVQKGGCGCRRARSKVQLCWRSPATTLDAQTH
jgi:hypothetical protein